ncbi:MAG: SDR family NAD(P)-dependent oxidoreductase [Halioglobus sp.]|nr:SDR family NAD(P)-dependent oxidoreductase [Halioglobus sp.]
MSLSRRQVLKLGAAGAAVPALGACGDDGPEVTIDKRFPGGPFGAESTAEEVTFGLDLSGMTALVTGCNSGLGYETMRVLALRGAHVLGTGRTLEKAEVACASVERKTTPLALELSDFQSVVDCAARVGELGVELDALILNAGINTFGSFEDVGGVEKMFVVNFLGHFVLANHLLPGMLAANKGRIVHVGSRSAYTRVPEQGIDFDNLRGEGVFNAMDAYGRSKLANALFSLELARQLEGTGVTSNVLHPGLVKTNIARTAPSWLRTLFDLMGGVVAKTPAQGAATQVYVATNPALDGVSGAYFEDCNPVVVSGEHHLYDAAMAARLWTEAERMSADYLI